MALLRDLSLSQQSFFSEVCRLVRLIFVMPATNAVSERSFSAMRRPATKLSQIIRNTTSVRMSNTRPAIPSTFSPVESPSQHNASEQAQPSTFAQH